MWHVDEIICICRAPWLQIHTVGKYIGLLMIILGPAQTDGQLDANTLHLCFTKAMHSIDDKCHLKIDPFRVEKLGLIWAFGIKIPRDSTF